LPGFPRAKHTFCSRGSRPQALVFELWTSDGGAHFVLWSPVTPTTTLFQRAQMGKTGLDKIDV
jgi:hypothetical protein